jgi:hypothetical protein
MSTIRSIYARTVMTVAAEPLASSTLILTLLFPVLLAERCYSFRSATKKRQQSNDVETEISVPSSGMYPLWISLILLFSPALEFPFMFVLHPVTLAYPPPTANVPSLVQLALQVGIFFAIQILFTHSMLRSISTSIVEQSSPTTTKTIELCQPKPDPDDERLAAIVVDFLKPRGTLLLGIAAMGIPLKITEFLGRLHPLAMVAWVVLDRLYSTVNRCK